jgi:hypothetical protein
MPSESLSIIKTNDVSSKNFLRLHNQVLKFRKQKYTPGINLLRVSFSPRYCHPALKLFFKFYKVHSTRDSLDYAISLFQTEDPAMLLRAQKILSRVVSLQDVDPASPHYGIWPKHWEESVSRIFNPDPNWADFLGSSLLLIKLKYHHHLSLALESRVDRAILHAARSIQNRNVDINYTNIAVRGTYVVLVAAEVYGISDLLQYGLKRLQQIHHSTMCQGIFTEYNSPVYQICILDALGRLRLHIKHAQARIWTNDLYRLAWQNIAQYFHLPTHQWAGPHSRSYSNLLEPYILALIERGTRGKIKFGLPEATMVATQSDIPLPCPVDLEPYFLNAAQTTTIVHNILDELPVRRLTTYMNPSFTLGSVSCSDLWHQRCSLMAYWGTPKDPGYLKLRFLCDGDDFAPAQFFSVQHEGTILAGITFATDIDKRNPYVACQANGSLSVEDLRLRFELLGVVTALNLSKGTPFLECQVEGVWVRLMMAYARLGDLTGHWEVTYAEGKTNLDWIFCTGSRRVLNWSQISVAGMAMRVSVSTDYRSMPPIQTTLEHQRLTLSAQALRLSFQVCPDCQSTLVQTLRTSNEI